MTDLDALRSEYESFQAKTRDWQAKVRDRDNMMKTRITESTQLLKEKDAQIESLETAVRDLTASNESFKQYTSALEVRLMESETSIRSVRDEAKRASDFEGSLKVKHEEVLKLRDRVASLEEAISKMRAEIDGSDILQNSSAILVKARCDVDHTTWCYVEGQSGGPPRWLTQDKIKTSSTQCVSLPATERDIGRGLATEESARRYQLVLDATETKHAIYESLQHHCLNALTCLVANDRTSFQSSLASIREHYEKKMVIVQSAAQNARELESSVEFQRYEADKLRKELVSLQDEHSQYKVKAQAALKRAQQQVATPPELQQRTPLPPCTTVGSQTDIPCLSKKTHSHFVQTDPLLPSSTQIELRDELIIKELLIKDLQEKLRDVDLLQPQVRRQPLSPRGGVVPVSQETIDVSLSQPLSPKYLDIEKASKVFAMMSAPRGTVIQTDAKTSARKVPEVVTGCTSVYVQTDEFRLSSFTPTRELPLPLSAFKEVSNTNPQPPLRLDSSSSFDSLEAAEKAPLPPGSLDFTALLYANNSSQSLNIGQSEHREFTADQAKRDLENERRSNKILGNQLRDMRLSQQTLTEQVSQLKAELNSLQMVTDITSFQKSVGNMEYLKNVMIRFMISKETKSVQKDLVPVLATLLRLSPEELEQVEFFYR